MVVRQVLYNGDTDKWAYIERSLDNSHFIILGGQEFSTKEEAEEFTKGFALDSYTWVDPEERAFQHYLKTRKNLISQIQSLDEFATKNFDKKFTEYVPLQEEIEQAADNYADLQDSCWINDYNGFMAGAKYVLNKYGLS